LTGSDVGQNVIGDPCDLEKIHFDSVNEANLGPSTLDQKNEHCYKLYACVQKIGSV